MDGLEDWRSVELEDHLERPMLDLKGKFNICVVVFILFDSRQKRGENEIFCRNE